MTWSSPRRHIFVQRILLGKLQSCTIISQQLYFILVFKYCRTRSSHWIVLCTRNNLSFLHSFSKLLHSFVSIELFNFIKNAKSHFYCSREISLFGLNKYYSLSKLVSKTIFFEIHYNRSFIFNNFRYYP